MCLDVTNKPTQFRPNSIQNSRTATFFPIPPTERWHYFWIKICSNKFLYPRPATRGPEQNVLHLHFSISCKLSINWVYNTFPVSLSKVVFHFCLLCLFTMFSQRTLLYNFVWCSLAVSNCYWSNKLDLTWRLYKRGIKDTDKKLNYAVTENTFNDRIMLFFTMFYYSAVNKKPSCR